MFFSCMVCIILLYHCMGGSWFELTWSAGARCGNKYSSKGYLGQALFDKTFTLKAEVVGRKDLYVNVIE